MKTKELKVRTWLKRFTIRRNERHGLVAPHTEEQNGRTPLRANGSGITYTRYSLERLMKNHQDPIVRYIEDTEK